MENRLFVDPFKLIVAVRTGSNSTGKSSLLNSLFKKTYRFTSRHEPGGECGLPISIASCVEFTWLTRENIQDDLWDVFEGLIDNDTTTEIFLLANLYGDVKKNSDIVRQLQSITTAYIVFEFPNKNNDVAEIFVLSPDTPVGNFSLRSSSKKIYTYPHNYSTRITIVEVLKRAYSCGKFSQTYNCLPLPKFSLLPEVQTEESQMLLQFLSARTCSEMKQALKHQSNSYSSKKEAIDALKSGVLNTLIKRLGIVLALPFERQQIAVCHLELEMSLRSGNESKHIRQELCSIKENMAKIAKDIKPEQLNYNLKYKELCKEANQMLKNLDRANLGFEHLMREIGRIYELVNEGGLEDVKNQMDEMIQNTAKLIIHGHAQELIDGDSGTVSGPWLMAIFKEIDRLCPNLRIYVISIIGMQSSGKSTLLNSLFGCKFPVSAGRCTRGLFMRLLFLDEEFKAKFGIDAIILIDTEGMCAPEKMMERDSDQRDRELATFAMLLSHLTIVNLMGEIMKEMTDILQIVIVTLARIEQVVIPPDVWLVQHLSEIDKSRIETAKRHFEDAITEAITVTQKKYSDLGIVNSSCLTNLQHRVQYKQFLTYFHLYKSGATASSSPSKQYYTDTLKLFRKLFHVIEDSKRQIKFHTWQSSFHTYWNALQKEDFSLKFKNIQDVYEFIERGTKIAKVNDITAEAIGFNRKKMKQTIRLEILKSRGFHWLEKFKEDIVVVVSNTIEKCPSRRSRPYPSKNSQPDCICQHAVDETEAVHKFVRGKPAEIRSCKDYSDAQRESSESRCCTSQLARDGSNQAIFHSQTN